MLPSDHGVGKLKCRFVLGFVAESSAGIAIVSQKQAARVENVDAPSVSRKRPRQLSLPLSQ
jgi:hypothetical protein